MKRILMVEPDKAAAKLYGKTLADNGFNVEWCSEPQSAILSADEKKPDLVILEIMIANHNGIEFLYEFRSYDDWQDVPVIVNSRIKQEKLTKAVSYDQLGISKCLDKNHLSPQKLVAEVQEILNI